MVNRFFNSDVMDELRGLKFDIGCTINSEGTNTITIAFYKMDFDETVKIVSRILSKGKIE